MGQLELVTATTNALRSASAVLSLYSLPSSAVLDTSATRRPTPACTGDNGFGISFSDPPAAGIESSSVARPSIVRIPMFRAPD